jgi:hypothetical protein
MVIIFEPCSKEKGVVFFRNDCNFKYLQIHFPPVGITRAYLRRKLETHGRLIKQLRRYNGLSSKTI